MFRCMNSNFPIGPMMQEWLATEEVTMNLDKRILTTSVHPAVFFLRIDFRTGVATIYSSTGPAS